MLPSVTDLSDKEARALAEEIFNSSLEVIKAPSGKPLVDFELLQLARERYKNGRTLSVACYLMEKYTEAIETLANLLPLNMAGLDKTIANTSDTAFLSLSYLRLGNLQEADKYRAMFDEAMKTFDPIFVELAAC